jgi:phage terminase large subunit-like protein
MAPRVAALSAVLARPFMPWQRRASALLNEHDGRGRRTRRFVVVTIQRQAGKTSWLLAEAVERCLFGLPRRRVWYTAQNGQYARDKWGELVEELVASPLGDRLDVKLTNGSERVTFPNGSTLRPFPPTRDALHSMQSDLVILDEAWKHSADRGAELMQAIGPTQATRPGAQVVVVSTAGSLADSTFLWPLVQRGRAGDPAIAYLEWSIPDHVDPLDVDAVAAYHPAVGHTIDVEFLRGEAGVLADLPGEYARAYGNRWTQTLERIIDPGVWADAATLSLLPAGRVALGADIAQDRSRAAIVAVNAGIIEVVDSRPGTDWIAARMLEVITNQQPAAVLVDRIGPSSTLADDLTTAGVDLVPLTAGIYAAACERFVDDLTNGRISYRPHPALDAAVDAAAQRPLGDGWAWGRRRAAAPICELVAATLASWGDQHRPAAPVRPAIYTE